VTGLTEDDGCWLQAANNTSSRGGTIWNVEGKTGSPGVQAAMSRDHNRRRGRSKLAAQAFGRRAEGWAVLWLRLKFYRILARRQRIGAAGVGEIDIIAAKGGVIAFIEVKARAELADAALALTPRQRQRLCRGAEAYLARQPALTGHSVRFDVMLLAPRRWPVHMIDAWREGE